VLAIKKKRRLNVERDLGSWKRSWKGGLGPESFGGGRSC